MRWGSGRRWENGWVGEIDTLVYMRERLLNLCLPPHIRSASIKNEEKKKRDSHAVANNTREGGDQTSGWRRRRRRRRWHSSMDGNCHIGSCGRRKKKRKDIKEEQDGDAPFFFLFLPLRARCSFLRNAIYWSVKRRRRGWEDDRGRTRRMGRGGRRRSKWGLIDKCITHQRSCPGSAIHPLTHSLTHSSILSLYSTIGRRE